MSPACWAVLRPLDESFASGALLEHPQYTKPRTWRGLDIPEVLLSGNHAAIARWRAEQRITKTASLRPDLLERWVEEDPDRLKRVEEARKK